MIAAPLNSAPIPVIRPGIGLMLVGPQGSGKTLRAFDIAAARSADYWAILGFELDHMHPQLPMYRVDTLIIDGIPSSRIGLINLKLLVTGAWPVSRGSWKPIKQPPALLVLTEAINDGLARYFDVHHMSVEGGAA